MAFRQTVDGQTWFLSIIDEYPDQLVCHFDAGVKPVVWIRNGIDGILNWPVLFLRSSSQVCSGHAIYCTARLR